MFTYDNLRRVLTKTLPDPDGAGAGIAPVWRYTYTAMGDVETETAPRDVVTTWRYDNLHRTETIDDGYYGAGTGGVARYGYDRYGRQNSVTDQMNVTTSWTLDALGRKTTQTDALGRNHRWNTDRLGQWGVRPRGSVLASSWMQGP